MNEILSKSHRLREAATALIEIDRAGLLPELKDEINAVRYRQRLDCQRQPIGMTPWLLLLAGELSRMTDVPRSDCESAMLEAAGTVWSVVAISKIIEFSEQNDLARRQSA